MPALPALSGGWKAVIPCRPDPEADLTAERQGTAAGVDRPPLRVMRPYEIQQG
jgi:hypothetical protein